MNNQQFKQRGAFFYANPMLKLSNIIYDDFVAQQQWNFAITAQQFQMSEQIVQGRPLKNPYVSMHQEVASDYPSFNESQTAATYEMHNAPIGRPISNHKQYQQAPQPVFQQRVVYQPQPRMLQPVRAPQPTTLNYANNRTLPTPIVCKSCKANVTTLAKKQVGAVAFAWALILAKVGMCCLPFCMTPCKDTIHYCPNCGAEAGIAKAKMCSC